MSGKHQPQPANKSNDTTYKRLPAVQQAVWPFEGSMQVQASLLGAFGDPRLLMQRDRAYLQRTLGNQALGQIKNHAGIAAPTTRNYLPLTLSQMAFQSPPTRNGQTQSPSFDVQQARSAQQTLLQRDEDGQEQSWYEAAGEWTLGAIGGEFVDEQTFGQIGVDFVLSVIPGVDQAADARDLTAHVYRLGFKREHNQWLRWVSLVFTLIGLFPEVGSVIKSLSKAVIRGISVVIEHIGDILRIARRVLPDEIADVWRLQRYIRQNWARFASFAVGTWSTLLARGQSLVNMIPRLFGSIRAAALAKLNNLRRLSPGWLSRAIERARTMIDDALERVRARFRQSQKGGDQPSLRPSTGKGTRPQGVPRPQVREEPGGFLGKWPQDPSARVLVEPKDDYLRVVDIYRGAQTKGNAGHMVADVIEEWVQRGNTLPTKIRISNLQPGPSREALRLGKSATDDPVFSRTIQIMLERLGRSPKRIEYVEDLGHLHIDIQL